MFKTELDNDTDISGVILSARLNRGGRTATMKVGQDPVGHDYAEIEGLDKSKIEFGRVLVVTYIPRGPVLSVKEAKK
jgi:hypothetical protein